MMIVLDKLKTRCLLKGHIIMLVVFLVPGVYFYWREALSLEGLVVWLLELVVIGFYCVFGVRIARKNGFVDGYENGQNGTKELRKN